MPYVSFIILMQTNFITSWIITKSKTLYSDNSKLNKKISFYGCYSKVSFVLEELMFFLTT